MARGGENRIRDGFFKSQFKWCFCIQTTVDFCPPVYDIQGVKLEVHLRKHPHWQETLKKRNTLEVIFNVDGLEQLLFRTGN